MNKLNRTHPTIITLSLLLGVSLSFASFMTVPKTVWAQATGSAQLRAPAATEEDSEEAGGAGETSTSSSELDEQVRSSILERVRNAATRGQVSGALHDLLTDKGSYIGEITRISEEAITLQTSSGSIIIPLTENVAVLKDDEVLLSVESIAVGNWATVLGTRQDANITPEFVIISETSLAPPPQTVVVGTIYELNRSELTITTRNTGEQRTFTINRDSIFEDIDATEVTWQDFEADFAVLVSAVEDKDEVGTYIISTVRSLAPLAEASDE